MSPAKDPGLPKGTPTRHDNRPQLQRGSGLAGCHFGELWQGVLRVPGTSALLPALCSLTTNHFQSYAVFEKHSPGPIEVRPLRKRKALKASREVLSLAGDRSGGLLRVFSQLPEGGGMGSSSSEILASARATAHAIGSELSPDQEAALLLDIDGAVDPVFAPDRALVFAHRSGSLVEDLGPLPPFAILAFDTDPSGHGIDTASLPQAGYDERAVDRLAAALESLKRGVQTQDISAIGAAATESARVNQSRVSLPHFQSILDIAEAFGVPGIVIAHTGTVAGFIVAEAEPTLHRLGESAQALGLTPLGLIHIGSQPPRTGPGGSRSPTR